MLSSPVVPIVSVRGSQQPRVSSVPAYASSSGPEAIRLARMAGLELDPWQQTELAHGLGEAADWKCARCTYRTPDPIPCPQHGATLIHPWAAFEVTSVVPRQNGKSELLIARMLAGLFILEEPLQIYSAHLFDTSMEIFRRLVFVVENCDDLRAEVKHRGSKLSGIKYSHGEEGIELSSGLRIRFKARTGGGGRGFSCDTLYLDEAMILREAFLGATVPTLSARANPQIWLAGSPPDEDDPTHDGVVLAKRRMRALAGGDPSLAYFEHSAEGDHPETVSVEILDDPQQWALANPGLGIRITPEYVANERRAMGSRQFAVERLGIGAWPDITGDSGRVISVQDWQRSAETNAANRVTSSETFAVDTDLDQTWASIGVAGQRDDERWQVHLVRHDRGKGWLIPACKDLQEQHPDARFVADPRGPAANLIDGLREAGIDLVEVSTADYGDACADFVAAAVEDALRYPAPQPDLSDSIRDARKQAMGDRWKWSRKNSTSADISPLVACTLALWGARNAEPQYATVLYGSDSAPTAEDPEIGPEYYRVGVGEPVVLTQADTTSCFACRVGGCTIHGG